ncbi:hypothetical protein FUAX_44680 (plasmid) [Fulvitalea axinellae]|uniref:Lipoprotein n=1 Tax=Fulvitalea axinellae TaxID=1182444 RepID=A0AAU9CIU4_9BACT|nr:hypothetical protein FUAX_44680 [Fulvitalea axinellae]
MRRFNLFFLLLLGGLVAFSSCSSDDDELTEEEKDQIELDKKVKEADEAFEKLVSKKWTIKDFVSSEDLKKAVESDDTRASQIDTLGKAAATGRFNLSATFTKEGDKYFMEAAINVPEADLEATLLKYQDIIFGFEAGFLIVDPGEDGIKFYSAEVKRMILAPFAPDALSKDEIADTKTGNSTLKVKQQDLTGKSLDDVILGYKKLIDGNNDRIFFNEDGDLVVEVTHEDFGTYHWVYTEVTE